MNLLDLAPVDAARIIARWVEDRGGPAYRAAQLLPRLWQRPVRRWEEATELPLAWRAALDEAHPLQHPRERTRQVSADGTVKFLWDFGDGGLVESVLIPEGARRTLCISSQAGCAYGCRFCATGQMGFVRHLAPWEIAAQVRALFLDTAFQGPTNVVFMGMGEPLHNWDAVDRALTILNDPRGCGIGARRITVSTIGIIPALGKLAQRREQFRLAVSLHAATSAKRREIMPVERKYPLADLLVALQQFSRRITFEYVMMRGFNDGVEDVARLAEIARPLGAHVNLLPLHPGGAPGLTSTAPADMRAFARQLRAAGVRVSVRKSRGLDIDAACGQLRTRAERRGQVTPEIHADV